MRHSLGSAAEGRQAPALRSICRAIVLALPLVGLGCDDAPEQQASAPSASPAATQKSSLSRVKWLDQHSSTAPEVWLASRQTGADLAEDDPVVLALRPALNQAQQRFGDSTRMIANRAVQLEDMLAAEGIEERAADLIKSLTSAATDSGPWDGFGSICQHYFNLRKQGMTRGAAIEQLKGRA